MVLSDHAESTTAPPPRAVTPASPHRPPSATTVPRVATAAPGPPPAEVSPPARLKSEPKVKEPPAPVAETPSESDLMAPAQRALRSDAARTLQLVEQHASIYPHGALVQEREVLRVESLVRLGRIEEAQARAEAFRAAFPASAYLRRIDRATQSIEGAPESPQK